MHINVFAKKFSTQRVNKPCTHLYWCKLQKQTWHTSQCFTPSGNVRSHSHYRIKTFASTTFHKNMKRHTGHTIVSWPITSYNIFPTVTIVSLSMKVIPLLWYFCHWSKFKKKKFKMQTGCEAGEHWCQGNTDVVDMIWMLSALHGAHKKTVQCH